MDGIWLLQAMVMENKPRYEKVAMARYIQKTSPKEQETNETLSQWDKLDS